MDDRTSEHYVAVSLSAVRQVFDAYAAVDRILEPDVDLGQLDNIRVAVTAAVNKFVAYNVPREVIGLYGGFQCGLRRTDGSIHDVDLLVRGQTHYANIVNACSGNVSRWLPERILKSPKLHAAALRRAELSQTYVALDGEELMVDVRIEPDFNDAHGASCFSQKEAGYLVRFRGTVVDAPGSLSLPACYSLMEHSDGRLIHLVSGFHHTVGAAGVGDVIEVCAALGRDGNAYIVNSSEHGMRIVEVTRE